MLTNFADAVRFLEATARLEPLVAGRGLDPEDG